MNINLININNILLWILLFFGLFDTARNYTYLPESFGYLKDITIYTLFFLNLKKIGFYKKIGIGFYAWMSIVIIITPFGFLYSGYSIVSILIACFKYVEFFLLGLIFINWNRIFGYSMLKFMHRYVYGSLILCFVNVFGYFVENPIVYRGLANSNMMAELYSGRMTVGQPPVAVFPVLISMIYLLVNTEKKVDNYILGVFIVCIVLSTSNTGIIAMVLSMLIVFIYGVLKSGDRKLKKRILFISIFTFLAVFYLICSDNEFISSALEFYVIKIGNYFFGTGDPSMNIRYVHWNDAMKDMNILNYIIGRGAYGFNSGSLDFPIENTYVMTFVVYGIIGVVAMAIFFGNMLYKNISIFRKNSKLCVLNLCILMTFMLHMYTLDLYLSYTLYFSYALFYAYGYYFIFEDDKERRTKITCK